MTMSSLPFASMGSGGFSANPRYAAIIAAPQPNMAHPAPANPVEDAFEQGFTEGYATASEEAERRAAQADAEREAITFAFARMDDLGAQEMAERLRQTVLALCEQAVLPLAIDAVGLSARITRAVAMLQRAQDERRVLIHPDDLALVHAHLPTGLVVEADPSVERGALRIETPDGGVEDGPSQWRRILAEAFREC